MTDASPAPPRAPKHVRDRDRPGHRCESTHPDRVVKVGPEELPVRCRIVRGHSGYHWSADGGVETVW